MNPEKWLVLTVGIPSDTGAEDLSEVLIALGGAAVQEDGGRLTTYLFPPPDPEAFVEEAERLLSAAAPGAELDVQWRWQENEDWAREWRKGLGARRVGERLIVTPTWIQPEAGPDDIVIEIDPEMAFGTGEHATTRGALRLLERAIRPGDRVLDVGTGSGILAIAAVRLGAEEVIAVEGDGDALINARDNVERNGVADRVQLVHRLVDEEYLAASGPGSFDLIVANVLSGVLLPLLPGFRSVLTPAPSPRPGRLILGGILEHEARTMIEAAMAAGFVLDLEDEEEEWWGGLFTASST